MSLVTVLIVGNPYLKRAKRFERFDGKDLVVFQAIYEVQAKRRMATVRWKDVVLTQAANSHAALMRERPTPPTGLLPPERNDEPVVHLLPSSANASVASA